MRVISNLKTLRHPVIGEHGQAVDVVELAWPFALEQSPDVGNQNLEQFCDHFSAYNSDIRNQFTAQMCSL
jgi:hypothetical protein